MRNDSEGICRAKVATNSISGHHYANLLPESVLLDTVTGTSPHSGFGIIFTPRRRQ